jgi:hypothetical protein
MASYDFNRILMGTAADSFSFERFFRELGLAALARKAFGAGCNVMLSPLQSCAPPGGGSVANLSRHPFHTNPASQRRAKFVVFQKADSRAQPDFTGYSRLLPSAYRRCQTACLIDSIAMGSNSRLGP